MKKKLLDVIASIADHAATLGIFAPNDAELTQAIKTEGYYERVFANASRDYYNDENDMDEEALTALLLSLMASQIRRAYIEGLREAGFDPRHMTGAMFAEIDEAINSEANFIFGYVADLKEAKENGAPIEFISNRVDLWKARFADMINRAIVTAAIVLNVHLVWEVGPTEHCSTCLALDQTVATATQWAISGYKPQRPPNALLECGGWRCQCNLRVTTAPATIPADGIITA